MEETTATTETQPFLGEDWFDPLETAVRGRIRGFIEEMLEAELHAALQRGRYDRQGTTRGHRHGIAHVSWSAPSARSHYRSRAGVWPGRMAGHRSGATRRSRLTGGSPVGPRR